MSAEDWILGCAIPGDEGDWSDLIAETALEYGVPCSCGSRALAHDAGEVYRSPSLAGRTVYLCSCGRMVGSHVGSRRPLGTPADAATRSARRDAHTVFDELWRRGLYTRAEAYGELARRLGLPPERCHFGFFEREQCLAATLVAGEMRLEREERRPHR